MFAIIFPKFHPIAIQLKSISIYWYTITYAISILLGMYYLIHIEQKYKIVGLNIDSTSELVLYVVIGIIIGGRLGYVVFYSPYILFSNVIETFRIWHGGMSFHGGVLGVILCTLIFSLRTNKNFLSLTDIISSVTPVGLFLGRIANFINAELYGKVTNIGWAIIYPNSDNLPRHPSQIYEAIFEGVILLFLTSIILKVRYYIIRRKNLVNRNYGFLSGAFLFFYSTFRMIMEIFRESDPYIGHFFGFITIGQILCIPMILIGLVLILRDLFLDRNNNEQ